MIPEFKDVARTEYEVVVDTPEHSIKVGDDWGCAAVVVPILVAVIITAGGINEFGVAGVADFFRLAFVGILGGVLALIVVAKILNDMGSTWFSETKVVPATTKHVPRGQITEKQQIGEHRCCIQCKHPTKALR